MRAPRALKASVQRQSPDSDQAYLDLGAAFVVFETVVFLAPPTLSGVHAFALLTNSAAFQAISMYAGLVFVSFERSSQVSVTVERSGSRRDQTGAYILRGTWQASK